MPPTCRGSQMMSATPGGGGMSSAPVDGEASFPLLVGQQSLWLAGLALPDQAAMLTGALAFLPAGTDPDTFLAACRLTIGRTETLRMRVTPDGRQIVTPPGDAPMPIRDVDLSGSGDPETAAIAWHATVQRTSIDPCRALPFAWALLRLAGGRLAWSEVTHHVAADATGRRIVAQRVATLYDALLAGTLPPPCDDVPLRTLVTDEAAYLASPQSAADAQWGIAQCADPPSGVSPAGATLACGRASHRAVRLMTQGETVRLRAAAEDAGASLAQLSCSAWATLLARLSGSSDLLLGFHVAARRPHARAVPAMLSNEVPLRLSVDPAAPFADLLQQVRRKILAGLRRQHHPHAHLRRALGLRPFEPDPLGISFNFLPRQQPVTFGGRPAHIANAARGPVYDLSLAIVEEDGGGLRLEIDGNVDLYAPARLDLIAARLALLLDALAAEPSLLRRAATGDLPVMDAAERRLVAQVFAEGPPAPPPASMAELFAASFAAHAEATALITRTRRFTYLELCAQACALARFLLSRGLGPGDVVALALPRDHRQVIAFVACALAGIAVCPLDLVHAPERRDHMLAACGARAVLAPGCAPAHPAGLALIDPDDPAVARLGGSPLLASERPSPVETETALYVAFTSGSTGLPKGVAVTQGAMALLVRALAAALDMGPGSTTLAASTLTFDVGMSDLYMSLSCGAAMVLLDEEQLRDPNAISAAALAHPRPALQATPSLWRTLPLETMPAGLRAVLGGEPFAEELVPRLARFASGFNAYGPTEATVYAAVHRVAPGDGEAGPVPIGRPLPGYAIWVLDPSGRLLPIGAAGELCIGGKAVAAGYLGDPALTARAFVPIPEGTGRMYRTGDRARWRADGRLEMLGRLDGQLKIAGHRIEPVEVEQALLALPGIAEAVVVAQGAPGRQRLIAYLVLHPNAPAPSARALREALSACLPPWMLPADRVVLDRMPRTGAGKVDKRALAPPMMATEPAGSAAPASALERMLRRLFCQIAGVPAVGGDDDFFEIGGDSLGAMVLLTELSQLGHAIPLSVLVGHRTPAGLAEAMHAGKMAELPSIAVQAAAALLVPGVGGDEPALAEFRMATAAGARFSCLDYPDWASTLGADGGMIRLASELAGTVCLSAPDDPIVLAGHSMGGLVALAVASVLQDQGRTVAGVLLFDTFGAPPPAVGSRLERIWAAAGYVARDVVMAFRDGVAAEKAASQLGRFLARGERPRVLTLLARCRGGRLPARLRYALRRAIRWEINARVIRAWQAGEGEPRLPAVPVILFRARGLLGQPNDRRWNGRLADLRIVEVDGDHISMLRERGPGSLAALTGPLIAELASGTGRSWPPA